MREIRFRGMSQGKNKQWVYGWLEMFANPMGIQPAVIHHFSDWGLNGTTNVDSRTVGQFTGLKDKNGIADIYEGDIIDSEGLVIGNIYESPQIHKEGVSHVIAGMGTEAWRDTESIAMGCGCKYSK